MRWWRRKRLMVVTGGSGFLGRHLLTASEAGGWELFAPGSQSIDVRRRELVVHGISGFKPNVVVHLAYRKHERSTIVDGSAHVAEAAAACGARLIHFSTDMVFAGRHDAYRESDATDAVIDYGRWKAEAEAAVAAEHPGAVIVRTSLMYGTEHVSPQQHDVEAAIAGRQPMTFFTDEFRCPAHAGDIADAVVALASMPEVAGPLHVAGPELLSRAQLAQGFAIAMGYDPARVPVGPTPASAATTRPSCLHLDTLLAASLGIRCRSLADALRLPKG
ncbi:MAG TPA: sugar nucleotide-binding protein [Ilumatobacteraceae bacterium]|nr:sugar nucleotide-binding protein [Ilumatobacteraceae bacterium]